MSTGLVVSIVLLLASVNFVHGWGFDGHSFTAGIAQTLLTDDATTFVRQHLPKDVDGNMSAVASWADQILHPDKDHNWEWSKPLHYVNIEDWSCAYNQQKDCDWTTNYKGCVDGAIQNYTERLANSQLDATQRQEALKFVIHFIGDVHQPLHGGFAGDRGGNSISGRFFTQNVNLHSLWDTTMIKKRIHDDFQSRPLNYLSYLIKTMKSVYSHNISDWTDCASSSESRFLACANLWIEEDAKLNCETVYRDEDDQKITIETGFTLGQTYFHTRMNTVELRLIQAGVRLGAVINKIVESIGREKQPDESYSTIKILLNVLIVQYALIIFLLIYSIVRRKKVTLVEHANDEENGEYLAKF